MVPGPETKIANYYNSHENALDRFVTPSPTGRELFRIRKGFFALRVLKPVVQGRFYFFTTTQIFNLNEKKMLMGLSDKIEGTIVESVISNMLL